ncbi:hypothetical protein ACWGSU_24365 [Streptomyces koyangensis]
MEFHEAVDYLYDWATMSPVDLYAVWDCAEEISQEGATFEDLKSGTLCLVEALLGRHVIAGDSSPVPGEDIVPWEGTKGRILAKIDSEISRVKEPLGFLNSCWFIVDRGRNSSKRISI